MKHYKVEVKCGHVGRNKYILKFIYLTAENGKEAAAKARQTPRVKHHAKDAIRNVEEISFEDYQTGIESMNNDTYFHVFTRQQQNLLNAVDKDELFDDINPRQKKYPKKQAKRYLKDIAIKKEIEKEMAKADNYETNKNR